MGWVYPLELAVELLGPVVAPAPASHLGWSVVELLEVGVAESVELPRAVVEVELPLLEPSACESIFSRLRDLFFSEPVKKQNINKGDGKTDRVSSLESLIQFTIFHL